MIALCLGGAPSVWDDLAAALRVVRGRTFIIVATNHAGIEYEGHLDAWVTLHPELFERWRRARADAGRNTDYQAFVHGHARGDAQVHEQEGDGSSGMYAAQVALQRLGCAGAILCGVPMEAEAGHITAPATAWGPAERYRPTVELAAAEGFPIRSMSGWTADVLGEPHPRWVQRIAVRGERIILEQKKDLDMRIRMVRTRNYTPPADRRLTVKFLEGEEYTVKQDWGRDLVKDGDAVKAPAPRRAD